MRGSSILLFLSRFDVEVEFFSSDSLIELKDFLACQLEVRLGIVALGDIQVVSLSISSGQILSGDLTESLERGSKEVESGTDLKLWGLGLDCGRDHSDVKSLGAHSMR